MSTTSASATAVTAATAAYPCKCGQVCGLCDCERRGDDEANRWMYRDYDDFFNTERTQTKWIPCLSDKEEAALMDDYDDIDVPCVP